MKCDYCHKPAVHHITRLLPSGVATTHMCQEHYQQYGQIGAELPVATVDEETETIQPVEAMDDEQLAQPCPSCGQTFRAFRETSKFGCSECYNRFESHLELLFKRLHKADRHIGKTPRGGVTRHKLREEVTHLERQKDQAVQEEDFERAARLRDQIRQLLGMDDDGS